jgi:AraC family transcriptional regulator of adaptative response/methylated-DNA-[protein]-cysteine methyltransferase
MKQLTQEQMIEAMLTRNRLYDGRFFVGVTSTRIFCLPSCKARKPNSENIVFFPSREHALAAGFRGCLRCRAAEYPDVAPEWLADVISLMKAHLDHRLSERDLTRVAGVDITTIRRHFRTHCNLTPMAFHRKLRLEHARTMIEEGAGYLMAAYGSGFESASGFRDAFMKEYGVTPGGYHERRSNTVQVNRESTGDADCRGDR